MFSIKQITTDNVTRTIVKQQQHVSPSLQVLSKPWIHSCIYIYIYCVTQRISLTKTMLLILFSLIAIETTVRCLICNTYFPMQF